MFQVIPVLSVRKILPFCGLAVVLVSPLAQAQTQQEENEAIRFNNGALEMSRLGKHEEAAKLFDRAIAIDSHNRIFYTNRARTLQRLGRFKEALSDANSAIELDEFSAVSYNLRASLDTDLRKWDEARADYTRAIALDPDQPAYVNSRAVLLLGTEQWSAALADFHRAAAMSQAGVGSERSAPLAAKNLADAYKMRGLPPFGAAPNDAPEAKSRALAGRFAPRAGEIRFEARCAAFNPKNGQLLFDALAFAVPGGRARSLTAPKRRTAILGRVLPENSDYGSVASKLLRAGDFLVIVGRDNGKIVTPRAVYLASRSNAEKKTRGALGPDPLTSVAGFQLDDGSVPPLDWSAVGRPTFVAKTKTYAAGTGFTVNSDGGKRLVSAWHLLANSAAPTPDGDAKVLLQTLQQVELQPFNLADAPKVIAAESLTRDGAEFTFLDASRDILVLTAPDATRALTLAQNAPQSGNLVWIASQQVGQKDARLIAATVLQSDEKTLLLLTPDNFSLQATSGAPLLNRSGEVVGMLLGSSNSLLVAAPLPALRARILP